MKNFEGYLKRKFGDSYVLLAGGGEKLLSNFAFRNTWNDFLHNTSEFTFASSQYSGAIWINYRTASGSADGAITQYSMCNGAGGYADVIAKGFKVNGSNDASVILAGGGTKALSDFSMSGHSHSYLPLSGGVLTNDEFYVLSLAGGTQGKGMSLGYTNPSDNTKSYTGLILFRLSDWGMAIANYDVAKAIGISSDGTPYYGWSSSKNTLIHSGNYTSYKHAYTNLTGSGTTANLAIVSTGTVDGWTLKTLGSNAFNSNSYALASDVMTFSISNNYLAAQLPRDMAVKAYNTYIEFWDGYEGAGWYNFLLGQLRAINGVKVLSNNSWTDVSLVGHTHNDLYITSVGLGSGDYANNLYYTKNGNNSYFTVNYASNSNTTNTFKYVDNWNVAYAANKINFMTCGNAGATGAPSGYTSGVSFMTSYVGFQLAVYGGGNDNFYFRKILDNGNWWSWREIIHTGNWSSFINLTSLGAAPAHDHPYVPLSGNSTINGIITISPTGTSGWQKGLVLHDSGGGTNEASWIEWTSGSYSNGVRLIGAPDSKALYFWDTNAWQTLYHSGNLPAYPTKASWNYDDRYLPLSGGTLSNTNFYTLILNGGANGAGMQFTLTGDNPKLGIVLFNPAANDWGMAMLNYSISKAIGIANDGTPYYGWGSTKYTLLHTGNSSVSKSGETLTVNIGGTSYSLTNTWRGIQDNLTSTSTSDSLSANLGKILNDKFDNYLVKTTYDYHKEFSAEGTNYIELGCFSLYDSMVGIDITLTTSLSWIGRLIISSQNINSSGGGSYEVNVRGDNSLSLHTLISIVRSGTYFRVYLNASGWKKLFCHIWCVAAAASEIFLTVSSMPSGNITINNPSGTFGGNVYATNFYTTSDSRKKNDIKQISNSIYQFKLKDLDTLLYGYIAQELEKTNPELVDNSGEYKTVNYNSAICFTIAKLETRIKELENEVTLLRKGGKYETI